MAEIVREQIPTAGYHTQIVRSGSTDRSTVMLLHGAAVGAFAWVNWMRAVPVLGEELHVIAPDLLGFGDTTHPDPLPYGVAAWQALRVEQLLAVLDHFDVERTHLVGNSLGGALALSFVLAHPERVKTITLMGTAGAPFKPNEKVMEVFDFYSDPTPERMRRNLGYLVYDAERSADIDDISESRLAVAMRPESRRSFEAMFADPEGQPLRGATLTAEQVQGIQHRALLIHGRGDWIIPLDASLWLLQHLPHADLHVFSECGHWAMLERPNEFNRLVLSFVTEWDDAPSQPVEHAVLGARDAQ